jgi:hypothetical protein
MKSFKKILYLMLVIPVLLVGLSPAISYAKSTVVPEEEIEKSQFELTSSERSTANKEIPMNAEIPVIVNQATGEVTLAPEGISPACATCYQYTWTTSTDILISRVFHSVETSTSNWKFVANVNINLGPISITLGGDGVYSSTKKWNKYKEDRKMTGVLKTYTPMGQLFKTENKTVYYTIYPLVATR